MIFLGLSGALVYVIWDVAKDLPDYKQLASYEPPVMTRIHAADGSLLAEYADERRLFVPINSVPKRLIQAYISAEDKTFFTHGGLDWRGIAAAGIRYVQVKLTGKGQIVVDTGLHAGDRVVVDGALTVVPGQPVTIVQAGAVGGEGKPPADPKAKPPAK